MKNKLILIIMLGIVLTSLVSAGLGTFKSGDCVDIKTILNTTDVTISSLSYPNSTNALGITNMDKSGLTFNYTFCDTSTIGKYYYDYNDSEGNVYVNDFEITSNGMNQEENYTGIALIILLGLTISIFVYLKLSKFFGSLLIMVTGFGVLFTATALGWVGWVIIGSGFLMIIYTILEGTKSKRDVYSLRG